MMKAVPPRVVDKVWGEMSKLSHAASDKMIEQLHQEQPVLLAYLGSVDEDSLNEAEREILVFLGMFFWQAMTQAGGGLPQVSEDAMRKAEAATVGQFETLATKGESESGGIDALLQACGQAELMDFALMTLMEAAGYDEEIESGADGAAGRASEAEDEDEDEDEDGSGDDGVRAENVPLIMLDLKTVVDVLNVSPERPRAPGRTRR
jgi:hypothetical protein